MYRFSGSTVELAHDLRCSGQPKLVYYNMVAWSRSGRKEITVLVVTYASERVTSCAFARVITNCAQMG